MNSMLYEYAGSCLHYQILVLISATKITLSTRGRNRYKFSVMSINSEIITV
jgi:hypothetical protein